MEDVWTITSAASCFYLESKSNRLTFSEKRKIIVKITIWNLLSKLALKRLFQNLKRKAIHMCEEKKLSKIIFPVFLKFSKINRNSRKKYWKR